MDSLVSHHRHSVVIKCVICDRYCGRSRRYLAYEHPVFDFNQVPKLNESKGVKSQSQNGNHTKKSVSELIKDDDPDGVPGEQKILNALKIRTKETDEHRVILAIIQNLTDYYILKVSCFTLDQEPEYVSRHTNLKKGLSGDSYSRYDVSIR